MTTARLDTVGMGLEDRILGTHQTRQVVRIFDPILTQHCRSCIKPDVWATDQSVLVRNVLDSQESSESKTAALGPLIWLGSRSSSRK